MLEDEEQAVATADRIAADTGGNRLPGLCGNPLLAVAGLDRLAHHAEIVAIQGDSFRAHGRQKLEEEVKIEITN